MRVLIHDYAGHPFAVGLSRELARRGHQVCHAYCASLVTTPQGSLTMRPDDPASFAVAPIRLSRPLEKFSFVRRWRQENEYGRLLIEVVRQFQPDVVLSGQAPLDAQRRVLAYCRRANIRFAFWLQDIIGLAAHRLLSKKNELLGRLVGGHYIRLEKKLLRRSDAVIPIAESFRPTLDGWHVDGRLVHIVENWAPIADVPLRPRLNAWSREHLLDDRFCYLYSGTLGLKHNPARLLELAIHHRDDPDVMVVVVSSGLGAEWLARQKEALQLENLLLLPFQSFEQMQDVLASADVLIALLEEDAGIFSVPSKVLTYLCAGRALLMSVPRDNLAVQVVDSSRSGICVDPQDVAGFLSGADELRGDERRRKEMGENGRLYAESAFSIGKVADRFESILLPLLQDNGNRKQPVAKEE